MLKSFEEVMNKANRCSESALSVAVAEDREVLKAIREAVDRNFTRPLLVGNREKILPLLETLGFNSQPEIIHEPDPAKAALKAVELVHVGEAQTLMKGLLNTSDLMHAVLNKEIGLRTGRTLSHLSAFEIPGWNRLLFVTDGGINIAPDLKVKKEILTNALLSLAAMRYAEPKVALLTANEQVSPKAQATVDAADIVQSWINGEFPTPCIVEGPIALDVALSQDSAAHKGIKSQISGSVDLFLASSIEVGNVMGKLLVHFTKARMAGLVLGASAPIILTSRSESVESKLCSIALGCLASTPV